MNPSDIDFVIYHKDCPDGITSAYAAWRLLGKQADYYSAVHGEDPPDVTNKNVAILDFSYDRDTIQKMIQLSLLLERKLYLCSQ